MWPLSLSALAAHSSVYLCILFLLLPHPCIEALVELVEAMLVFAGLLSPSVLLTWKILWVLFVWCTRRRMHPFVQLTLTLSLYLENKNAQVFIWIIVILTFCIWIITVFTFQTKYNDVYLKALIPKYFTCIYWLQKSLFVHTEYCHWRLYYISPFSRISRSAIDIKFFPVKFGLLVHFISPSMCTRYQVFFVVFLVLCASLNHQILGMLALFGFTSCIWYTENTSIYDAGYTVIRKVW